MGNWKCRCILPTVFNWCGSCFSLMLLSASKYILSKLKNISPLNAYRYQAKEISSRKERKSIRGASICKMAWYNLWNSKRKFIITVVSLFMGCETIMLAGFIMNGTNLTNEFSQSPDFEIGTQKEALKIICFLIKTQTRNKRIRIPRYLMNL